MSSSVLVVVIVAVVIAVAVVMTVGDSEHAATPPPTPDREPGPASRPDLVPVDWGAPEVAPRAAPRHLLAETVEPLAPTRGARARAALLLVMTVVVLGSLVAGTLGGLLYVGMRALDRAVG